MGPTMTSPALLASLALLLTSRPTSVFDLTLRGDNVADGSGAPACGVGIQGDLS
jgi:hypothetical protein